MPLVNRKALGPPQVCSHMEHFLETCLLFLIGEKADHGYSLVDRLAEFGFTDESLNVGTLYRTLRRLEKGGFAASDWESSG
ncbi:MAG: PadR family transcriptional regulator, partial [Firmicutes bacterium]|nr:PadR family transcriptional regulator [Bacillota bacterium]